MNTDHGFQDRMIRIVSFRLKVSMSLSQKNQQNPLTHIHLGMRTTPSWMILICLFSDPTITIMPLICL